MASTSTQPSSALSSMGFAWPKSPLTEASATTGSTRTDPRSASRTDDSFFSVVETRAATEGDGGRRDDGNGKDGAPFHRGRGTRSEERSGDEEGA
jgi:hypothetical protein